MSRAVKLSIIVGIAVLLFFVGFYLYGRAEVAARHKKAEQRLDGVHMVRGDGVLTPALVRRRVVERMNALGLAVAPQSIEVRLEKITADNMDRLPKHVRSAVAIARKLPNHGVRMWLLQLRFPVEIRSGLVGQTFVIQRAFAVKGAVRRDTGDEEGQVDSDEIVEPR